MSDIVRLQNFNIEENKTIFYTLMGECFNIEISNILMPLIKISKKIVGFNEVPFTSEKFFPIKTFSHLLFVQVIFKTNNIFKKI